MTIDRSGLRPEIRAKLEQEDKLPPATPEQLTPEGRRAAMRKDAPINWGPKDEVAHVDDITVATAAGPLRARLYRPEGARGTMMYLHGGGWALGDIDSHDGPCRRIANLAGCNVFSLEYRKSPEHPFPAQVVDTDAGLDWLVRDGAAHGLDTSKIVVSGVSAGGMLAAVAAVHARNKGIALAGQVLIVPIADLNLSTASYRAFADGFNLTAAKMAWFIEQTFRPEDRNNPDAAPLLTPDVAGVAPALVITAAFDPLRDDGRAYAAKLIAAGVDTTYVEVPGTVHATWNMAAITPAAYLFTDRTARWVAERLA